VRVLTLPSIAEVTEADKIAALKLVLQSRSMARSSRNSQLLKYLVEQECAGKSHEIKAFTIAVDVYGYGTDFDAGENSIVRAQMNSLRKRLLSYYKEEGLNDGLVISIPVGRYVPTFDRRASCIPVVSRTGIRARAIAMCSATASLVSRFIARQLRRLIG